MVDSYLGTSNGVDIQASPADIERAAKVLDERSEQRSLITTTNLPFGEWTKVFPEPRLCKAVVDRLTFNAHIIETGTESWRFRKTLEAQKRRRGSPQPEAAGRKAVS